MEHSRLAKQTALPLNKRSRYIALGILLGLCLVYLFRSCTSHPVAEFDYAIGQDPRWRDLQLMGKEGNLSAFNRELLATIAKQGQIRIHLIGTTDPLKELEQGKLQGILTTLEPSYLNENRLLFSEPYFLTGPVLMTSITPLANGERRKTIGIPLSSPLLVSLEQDPAIQVKIYQDILMALSDLRANRIDGAIFPVIPAYTYTQTFYKNELKIATLPLTNEGIRLVTSNNSKGTALMKAFNEGLKSLKQNGTYKAMLEEWGLIDIESIVSNQ